VNNSKLSNSDKKVAKRMNFNHLLVFHKVAEKRHFTRAAEELFISQPAVSKQVHELEKKLGMSLFTQVGRKIYLTEAGQLLYHYSKQIFALAAEAEVALGEMTKLERGHLRVGASTTIGTYLLPELLGLYRERYPHVQLSVDIANATEIQERVLAYRTEIGIVEGSVTHNELFRKVWREDELVLIASPLSPFTSTDVHLHLRHLLENDASFILRELGSGTREVLEEALEMRGFQPIPPFIELGSTEAIKQAVRAGLGLAFVSEHAIKLELAAGLLRRVPLVDFKLTRPLFIVYPKQKRVSKAAHAFLELLLS
jgi:DNA-binding transcriptional LysR family regulator